LLIIELLALGLLLALAWQPRAKTPIPKAALVLGGGILLLPLLFLMPLPEAVWQVLPGRDSYAHVLQLANPRPGWQAVSLVPGRTEAAVYASLPALAVFGATFFLTSEQVRTVVFVVVGIAVFQAILGLLQFGAGPGSPLYLGNPYAWHAAAGTYANRDHLAGLLEMVFPVSLALLVATLGREPGRTDRRRRGRWRRRMEFMASMRGHRAGAFAIITILLLLGLVFTRSRAGVALAMLGLFLAMLAFARRLGGSNVYGTLGTLLAVAVILMAEVGLAPVLNRLTMDPLQDARWTIYSTTLQGIGRFFPLGSGAGTYPQAYPAFQVAEIGPYVVNHAHSDYLETVFEQGMFSLGLIVLGLWLYIRQWRRLWITGNWGTLRFIQVGAGIGLALMLLHSLVDFGLHMPANLITFSFLAAVFLRGNTEEQAHGSKRRHHPKAPAPGAADHQESADRPPSGAPPRETPDPQEEAWATEKNPFL
jgi:hypothetical protein